MTLHPSHLNVILCVLDIMPCTFYNMKLIQDILCYGNGNNVKIIPKTEIGNSFIHELVAENENLWRGN